MAKPYKTSTAELAAIYKLEFYKKQNSWKYFSQERMKEANKRRAARKALREKLNQTYDIGPAPDEAVDFVDQEAEELKDLNLGGIEDKRESPKREEIETEIECDTPPEDQVDALNEAFVDTETDDTAILATDSSTYLRLSPKWSIQQWATQRQKLWKRRVPSNSTQNAQVYPTQDPLLYPTQDPLLYPTQDPLLYPTQDPPLYPTQDPAIYPAQDTHAYVTLDSQVTHVYPTPETQAYPIQDSPFRPVQDTQVYPIQPTQLHPIQETPPYKQITQVYPTPDSQVYPIQPNQPNFYSPELSYRADVPTFSPALPQCGASVDTGATPYGAYGREGWPRRSQVWTRHEWNEGMEISSCGAAPASLAALAAGDRVDGPAGLLGRAQSWLAGSHLSEMAAAGAGAAEGSESVLSVSSEEFSRGAALAPHSTEIDLRISSSSEEMAAGLSAAALSAAVARHADALQALLGEARKRDLASPSIVMHSFDEHPVRDGPSYPTIPTTTTSDVIVAGSFRNKPDLCGQTDLGASRERGKRTDYIIGISLSGRPYRIRPNL